VTDYVFVYSGGSMPETEGEQAKVMQAWNDWFGEIGGALKDGGNPFTPASKSIGSDGSVSDGPKGGNALSGYSIVQADSLDAAVAIAKKSPVLMGGADITVYETFEVMM
jgi:hypothetical protein